MEKINTPLRATLILHCYARADWIENEQAPAVQEELKSLVASGILEPQQPVPHYKLTPRGLEFVKTLLATPFPVPEEPETSAHIDKCVGNVTEPINPTCDNTTHKFSHCDCKQPSQKDTSIETCPSQKDAEWRELGPDEERVNGQFTFDKPAYSDKCRICGEEYGFHMGGRGDEAFCRRTQARKGVCRSEVDLQP